MSAENTACGTIFISLYYWKRRHLLNWRDQRVMLKSSYWCVIVLIDYIPELLMFWYNIAKLDCLVSKKKGHVLSNRRSWFRTKWTAKPSTTTWKDQWISQHLNKTACLHERIGKVKIVLVNFLNSCLLSKMAEQRKKQQRNRLHTLPHNNKLHTMTSIGY